MLVLCIFSVFSELSFGLTVAIDSISGEYTLYYNLDSPAYTIIYVRTSTANFPYLVGEVIQKSTVMSQLAGEHSWHWDGSTAGGLPGSAPTGYYYFEIVCEDTTGYIESLGPIPSTDTANRFRAIAVNRATSGSYTARVYLSVFTTWGAIRKRIQTYSGIDGADLGTFGAGTGITWSEWAPWGIAIDTAGNVYIGDSGNRRIFKFNPDGSCPYGGETAVAITGYTNGIAVTNFASNTTKIWMTNWGADRIDVANYKGSTAGVAYLLGSPGLTSPFIEPRDLAVIDDGSVNPIFYVACSTGAVSVTTSALRKYIWSNASGNYVEDSVFWRNVIFSLPNVSKFYSVELVSLTDRTSDIFVEYNNSTVRRITADGLAYSQYCIPEQKALDIALDGFGNLYVTCSIPGAGGSVSSNTQWRKFKIPSAGKTTSELIFHTIGVPVYLSYFEAFSNEK